jgi:hypothetical protein
MTDRIALIMGLIIVAAAIVDVLFYGTQHIVFLSKKLFDLTEWLAFWR